MPQFWPPPPPQSGVAPNIGTTLTPVSFWTPFAAPPVVVATVSGSRVAYTVQNVTATGFSASHAGTGLLALNWIATPAS
jgi:hypothetical protein